MIEIKRNNGSPVKVFAETFEYEAYDQVKALNKLYVEITNGRWIGRTSDVPQSEDSVEYIRKDALMERLKKVAAEYKKRSDEGQLVWQNMCGINEAIDILNEM